MNKQQEINESEKKYENIDDITRGFVVKDGKLMYVTNILDGYRHEFKDIHEICDEMNAMMKQLDSLTELRNSRQYGTRNFVAIGKNG